MQLSNIIAALTLASSASAYGYYDNGYYGGGYNDYYGPSRYYGHDNYYNEYVIIDKKALAF